MNLPSRNLLLSWRTVFLLLCLANLKSLPFSWHLRLFYRFMRNWYHPHRVTRAIQESSDQGTTHPIFQPVSIHSRSPLYETDYNLHKSNATYFSDLDESRTALVTQLYGPALRNDDGELEREGHRGRTSVILGGVHTTFHREIKPYERYEVRSRVLGWDQKWMIIGSFFIRPGKKGRGGGEVLLASSLSKYVAKKARFTISPERCLTTAGWLPIKPEASKAGPGHSQVSTEESASTATDTLIPSPAPHTSPNEQPTPQSANPPIATPIPSTSLKPSATVEQLDKVASQQKQELSGINLSITQAPRAEVWDWDRIDTERLRGLQRAANWLELDAALIEEYGHGVTRDREVKVK